MKKLLLTLVITSLFTPAARARLNVVATLPDYASLAESIGGAEVRVTTLARGTEDAHFVDPKPSFLLALNRADVLLESGAELELGWLPPLLQNARNRKILPGQPGHVRLSAGVRMLEIPARLDRSQGDVHAAGNPHYNLDPENGRIMARTIADAFARLDAQNDALYRANLAAFLVKLDAKLAEWKQLAAPLKGVRLVCYHKTFEYLAERFGCEICGYIEPKPGLEPSPAHINDLIPKARAAGARLVIMEPNRPARTPQYVAQQLGVKLVAVPAQVGGVPEVKTYLDLIEHNLRAMTAGLAR